MLIAGMVAAGAARAQTVRPWTPSTFDSLHVWAARADAGFREQRADTIDETTILPFERVGAIARHYLSDLGRPRARQAPAIEGALDSLGFDTDVAQDAALPAFVLVVVRNARRPTSPAVGFLFWFRGETLLEQAIALAGGHRAIMRVWWNDDPAAPYSWAIVDRAPGIPSRARFYLLRLSPDGGFWSPVQYEGRGPELGTIDEATWTDLDADGIPELMTWGRAEPDPLFVECAGCPVRRVEQLWTYHKNEGFSLHDSRLLPSPYSIFVLFIHLLLDQNRAAAARLLEDPKRLDEAIRLGWGTRRAPGTWSLEYAEDERWPRWLAFRYLSPRGAVRYTVTFTQRDGRWIIRDWKRLEAVAPSGPAPTR